MNESEERTGLEPRSVPQTINGIEEEEPPGKPRRHPLWRDVPENQWNDWRWQSQNAIRSVRQLRALLPFSAEELEAIGDLEAEYKLAIPPYYFSLINPDDPCDPIRMQSVPSALESNTQSGYELEDPLEEDKDSPVPGLTHRYPDRALLVTTHVCTMYCRFCTRKRATMVRGGWDAISRNDERMVEYVRDHSEIRDVIVSGGDPLTLPVTKLRFFLENLSAIPHVDVIRIGTRVPVTLPQKLFDSSLIELLASAEKVWIQTHFNHPREITPEAARVCKALLRAGMPVNNHTVLMKGVNDSLQTMRQLMRGLLRIKVRPYYLFHCDPVIGAGHFRTSVWKGLEIVEGLRGHMSGLGIPTYVVDSPHGGGKIPLMPNYLVSASNDAVVLRNYEGMLVRYQAEDKPNTVQPTATRGVSSLLQGTRSVIMPENSERMARRKLHVLTNARDDVHPDNHGCGGGGGDFRAGRIPRHDDGLTDELIPVHSNGETYPRMKVGITYDLKTQGHGNGPADVPDDFQEEFDSPATIEAIASVLRGLGHDVRKLGNGRELLQRLLADPPDLVFNFAEGEGIGRSREARVPAVLEMLGIPYSGSDPLTLAVTLDKDCAKRLVASAGVPIPPGVVIAENDPLQNGSLHSAIGNLQFPVIVKPAWEGSSKGIRAKCLVDSPGDLPAVVESLRRDHRQPILVEEFIHGDELTVGVLGNDPPTILGVMRVLLRQPTERFVYSLEIKRDFRRLIRYECPARLPAAYMEVVRTAALAAYQVLGCRDVSRIDFRLRDGIPYFLEVNPLPGLNPESSDLVIMAQQLDWSYRRLVETIMQAAIDRQKQ